MNGLRTIINKSVLLIGVLWQVSLSAMPEIMPNEEGDEEAIAVQQPAIDQPAQTLPQPTAKQTTATNKSNVTSHFITSFSSEGPNTVNQPEEKIGTSGNWVKKKDFLMRAFDMQKEIEELATQIQSYRSIYQQKFNAIDDQLDIFYKQLGLEQGKVQGLFSQLNEYIEKKKQRKTARIKENIKDVREQQLAVEQLEESLKTNKDTLEQLKADMKSIEDLDKSINTRLQKADEQIAVAQQEAARTQEIVQSMWDMIDDKRAKAAYFELKDGILRKLQTINSYLQQDLLGDLEKVAGTIEAQIKKTREEVKQLEDKGFIIQDRGKKLEELKIKKTKEAEAAAATALADQQKKQIKLKKVSPPGFFTRMYNKLVDFIANICRFFINLFSSTPEPTIKVKSRRTSENTIQGQPAPTQQTPDSTQGLSPATGRQSFAKPVSSGQQPVPPGNQQQTAPSGNMPVIPLGS